MDRRERGADQQTALLTAFEGQQSGLWTALPGILTSVLSAKRTVSVQPALRSQVQAPDGSLVWTQLPMLVDCPAFFPSGGGVTLTFPLKVGDECLVVFASRCIDAWWQSGGVQNQAELRMHDLSDGFVFVGFSSVPKVIAAISATDAQLRSDDGTAVIGLNPTTHAISIQTTGNVGITAGGNLNLAATGNIVMTSAGLTHNGKNVGASHTHGGVTIGGGSTDVPN